MDGGYITEDFLSDIPPNRHLDPPTNETTVMLYSCDLRSGSYALLYWLGSPNDNDRASIEALPETCLSWYDPDTTEIGGGLPDRAGMKGVIVF